MNFPVYHAMLSGPIEDFCNFWTCKIIVTKNSLKVYLTLLIFCFFLSKNKLNKFVGF